MSGYKICSRCIMDTTSDPDLVLDEKGVCNYCHAFDEEVKKSMYKKVGAKQALDEVIAKIKEEGKNKEYDCMLGISGGVDSSYVAYLAKQYQLRVLAVHVDAGWNSELAVQNIEKMCSKLGYDLHTIVIDWPAMKELQRAYMFSGLVNLDVPQDHCFFAACKELVHKFQIKYFLTGYNLATEGILSTAYEYTPKDWDAIKGVYRECGRGKTIKKYPHETFLKHYLINPYLYKIKTIRPLDYIDYSKQMAIETLEREFGWKYYGGKHHESRFTKFYQEVYLQQRYGWNKKRDHLSSLVVGGEMTREEALEQMKLNRCAEKELEEEKNYVLKKLDISEEEWKQILALPHKTEDNYPNNKRKREVMKRVAMRFK